MATPPVQLTSTDISDLARDLKATNRTLMKQLRARMKAAALPVAERARQNASWSTRIPGAIAVRVSYPAKGVRIGITVSKRKAPHGRPWENAGEQGPFLHPVFGRRGRDDLVQERARPFFLTAAVAGKDKVAREVQEIANDIASQITRG